MKRKMENMLAAGFVCILIGTAGIVGAVETGTGMKVSVGITLIGLICLSFGTSEERSGESEKEDIGGGAGSRDAG